MPIRILQSQMAERLNVATKTIERDAEKLASLGVIRFEGDKKSGIWVLQKQTAQTKQQNP